MAVPDSEITIRLFIDAGKTKVLFAEAGQDFIDLRLRPLLHPFGFMAKVGFIEKLYRRVQKIDNIYLVEKPNKSTPLQPRLSSRTDCCVYCGTQLIFSDRNNCITCYRRAHSSGYNVNSGAENGGEVAYMITDDLEITPMSAGSIITQINRFSMNKDLQLKEKRVVIGLKEIVNLILAAKKSSATALTDVFLNS